MTTAVHPYIESLLTGSRDLPASPHAWLNERRGAALERANELTVPTTRDEEWRFTDLTPLTRLQLRRASARPDVSADALRPHEIREAGARLVFVDGLFAPELSKCPDVQAGVRVCALTEALKSDEARLEPVLARLTNVEHNVFAALNTAHLHDAAVILIGKNRVCERPVHVLHLAGQAGTAAYPRCLVIADSGAECTVIEEYAVLSENAYFTNAVTEIAVAANARLHHIKLQSESAKAFHIATCAVRVAKAASYTSQAVSLGGRLSRYELNVTLDEGASSHIDGLAMISGRQLADTHTLIDHAQPNGRSVQLHKTIVGGGAHAVFNGKIFVRPGAQLTDSAQESRNLLLSDKAQVDTKPQLEIFADDVKCAHGATVGQLDAEQLFYLRSRGMAEATARNLLTYAFAASVIERIPVRSLVERLERSVMAQTGARLMEQQ